MRAVPDRTWYSGSSRFRGLGIAASAGGVSATRVVLSGLPADFPLPVFLAQHRASTQEGPFLQVLRYGTRLEVVMAQEGEQPRPGQVYVAPSGRHLELHDDGSFRVSRQGRYEHVWPSANLLFESMARVYAHDGIGLVLSGMGCDGAAGLATMRSQGAFVLAQDEGSSWCFDMPGAAIETNKVDLVLDVEQIAFALRTLTGCSEVPLRTNKPGPN